MNDNKFEQMRKLLKQMVTAPDTPNRMLIQCQLNDIINHMEADIDNIYCGSTNNLQDVSNLLFK